MTITRRADKRVNELEAEIEALMAETQGGAVEPLEEAPSHSPDTNTEPVELSPSEKTYEKRYGDLRRHSQKIEKELKDRIAELEAKPAPSPSSLTREQIKQWADTNPQASAIIRAIAEEQAGSQLNTVKNKLAEVDEINHELTRTKALTKVMKVHSDFDEIVNSTEFHTWAERQPKFIQDKIYDNFDADDTIWAISLYKRETKTPTIDRTGAEKVRSSKTSPTAEAPRSRFTESVVRKMSAAEFEKYEAEIMEARKHREFYDITDVSGYR